MAGQMTGQDIQGKMFDLELKSAQNLTKLPDPDSSFAFGAIVTDHMMQCDFLSNKGGWQTPKILPFAPFEMRPDSLAFHYGQQIFEGMKAYQDHTDKNCFNLFRPNLNARRFYHSALRLGMQPVPE